MQIVLPVRTRHCKLCQRCFYDMDHHCLFLNRCVARHTHRLFIIFIITAMIAMVMFEYVAICLLRQWFPNEKLMSIVVVGQLYYNHPFLWTTMIANGIAWIWGVNLIKLQLQIISKGHTGTWQPNRGATLLSRRERINNIIYFFFDRRRYRWDPVTLDVI